MALPHEIFFVVPLLMILVTLASDGAMSRSLDVASIAQKLEEWMAHYGRNYLDSAEKDRRFQIFKKNYDYVEKFNNAGNNTYKLGINMFSDLTTEEFLATHTGFKMPPHQRLSKTTPYSNQNLTNDEVPESFDWRDQGAVTDIKNQGSCGCCWAFSAVAAIEGAFKIKNDRLLELSEEQLLDCVPSDRGGCKGGSMDKAFRYIIENGGITTESSYPYEGSEGSCDQQKAANTAVQISNYNQVTPSNEQELQIAVHQQPVSIAISVGEEFKHYGKGVYRGSCNEQNMLNHAVTIVGYGTAEDGTKYWLIKNSWSTSWGENGYMKILRESSGPQGHCQLAKYAYYPIV